MNDDAELEPHFFPRWKQAVKDFIAAGFDRGAVVPHEWLWNALGIEQPMPSTPSGEADTRRFAFLAQFTEFRKSLLEDHFIDLVSERNVGYLILPASEQSKMAYEDGVAEIRKAMRKMGSRLVNIDLAALSEQQRSENAHALAKMSMMADMMKQQRRLPPPQETD